MQTGHSAEWLHAANPGLMHLARSEKEMSVDLLLPPKTVPEDALAELGQRVSFTHRAAVVRWSAKNKIWFPTEGILRSERWPRMWGHDIDWNIASAFDYPPDDSDQFWVREPEPGFQSLNKSVIVWPVDGTGIVTGMTRRGIGHGWPSSGGYNGYVGEYDYEPGGFSPLGWLQLYAIMGRLEAPTNYLLVPTWAAR